MKEKMINNMTKILFPLFTFLIALIVGGILLAAMGYNPLQAYQLILLGTFKNSSTIGNALANSIPLMLSGLAVSIAGKAGILNLGVEGQLYIGGILATVCGLYLPIENKFITILIILLASMFGGMIWGGLVGLLKAKFGTNEVVVALMLNYIAILFTSYLVAGPLKDPDASLNQSLRIPEYARFKRIIPHTQITIALVIAMIVCVLIWFIFKHTVLGYKMIGIGANAKAALANGIQCKRYLIIAMCLSGAVAGLVGSTEIVGKYYRFTEGFSNDIGFTGVAIAALAGYNPFGVVVVSILFGILNAGSLTLGREMGLSSKMFMVLQGVIVLFVATPYIIEIFTKNNKKKIVKGDK